MQPSFFTNLFCDQKIVDEYRAKYHRISTLLDEQPAILDAVHQDLKRFGSDKGRGAKFSSEVLSSAHERGKAYKPREFGHVVTIARWLKNLSASMTCVSKRCMTAR